MEVKYVKSSPFLYLNRIHIATFLPFRAYNTDNQLIIDSGIKSLETKLDEIRKNTKNYNGRG